jgi:hypothetical protein
METWIEREKNSSQFIEKAYDLELTLTQSIHKTPFTELCSLSSEKGYIDMKRCNLSLINASILFDTLPDQKKPPSGNGFAKFVTISDIFSSPSIQMKEFSGYLNFSKETL